MNNFETIFKFTQKKLLNKYIKNKEDIKKLENILLKIKNEDVNIDILKFLDILLQNSLIDIQTYYLLKSEILDLKYEKNNKVELPEQIFMKFPFDILLKYKILPLKIENNKLIIGVIDKKNYSNYKNIMKNILKKDIELRLIDKNFLEEELEKITHKIKLEKYKQDILNELNNKELIINKESTTSKLLFEILNDAIKRNTSDIHIERGEKTGYIKFRIWGTLREYTKIDVNIYNALVSKIKLFANLNISEKRKPQDGAFSLKIDNKDYDFRVSTLPTIWGESVVLRILAKENILKNLEDIGIDSENLKKIKEIISKPNGMFIVTGPTGSGKSTTLYSILNEFVKKGGLKIITVEDPVEYKLEGIQQVQVNPKIGLTFASALRSILRQDPDIIMIGEIRDSETLEIAIKAALTGHFVLTTLHTNDSISAIDRMKDMGIDSYLLGPAIAGISAQRLVKTNCNYCKSLYTPDEGLLMKVKEKYPNIDWDKVKFYKGIGCKKCDMKGYSGRTMVIEVFKNTKNLESLIVKNKTRNEIEDFLRKNQNFKNMFENGLTKVLEGKIPLEELFKVTDLSEE